MKDGALALVGTSTIPSFLTRSVMAEMTTAAANKKKLVVLFQRGAADGLNIVVPYREKNYYAMRPTIGIKQNEVLDLDGFFGLHPSMAAFKPLYEQGHLAIVHAAGSPDTTRSHFDAQDYMESGTPGVKSTADGWLNRALQEELMRGSPRHFGRWLWERRFLGRWRGRYRRLRSIIWRIFLWAGVGRRLRRSAMRFRRCMTRVRMRYCMGQGKRPLKR